MKILIAGPYNYGGSRVLECIRIKNFVFSLFLNSFTIFPGRPLLPGRNKFVFYNLISNINGLGFTTIASILFYYF